MISKNRLLDIAFIMWAISGLSGGYAMYLSWGIVGGLGIACGWFFATAFLFLLAAIK